MTDDTGDKVLSAEIISREGLGLGIDEEVSRAYKNKVDIIKYSHDVGHLFLALGKLYKECRDKGYYKLLDYDSFNEFLGDPELPLKAKSVYQLIHTYELYVQRLGCSERYLAEIGSSKLQVISPIVERDPQLWLDRAKELSRSDLIVEVNEAKGLLKEGDGDQNVSMGKAHPADTKTSHPVPLINIVGYEEWLRDHDCLICGKRPVDLAHFPRTKARGGSQVIPLCRICHAELHTVGVDTWLVENKLALLDWFHMMLAGLYAEAVRH